MQSDILYAHNDDLTKVVDVVSWVPQNMEQWHNEDGSGTHSGISVLEWERDEAEDNEFADINWRIFHSSGTSIPAEVLPGEIICADGVIRRSSALVEPPQDKGYQNSRKVTVEEAKQLAADGAMIVWRPKGFKDKFALILEEGE